MTHEYGRLFRGNVTLDGAGVELVRLFGFSEAPLFDPFLLLDEFGSTDPERYLAGFPWHPHRGIETVTYMLSGQVRHRDSLGNSGVIGQGDVQWMTAGGGIIHEEMPLAVPDRLRGMQLWVNLPAADKMIAPRYRDLAGASIPVVARDGSHVTVIGGTWQGTAGAGKHLVVDVTYVDIALEPGATTELPLAPGRTAFAYVYDGEAVFGDALAPVRHAVLLFSHDAPLAVRAGGLPARILFAQGKPLGEPVAWRGPIVMNTRDELDRAFADYEAGRFARAPA